MSRGKSTDNKKKPARVAAGPEAPGFARSLGENTGRLLGPVLPLVLIFAFLGGFSFLMWRSLCAATLNTENGVQSGERLTEKSIRAAIIQKPRPQWISREDYEQAANLGLFANHRSIFEANLSRSLAERYETSPWVDRVRAVRLRYPAQLELEIDWRKPAARVERTMVVDRQGYVLNLMADSAAARDTPVISGVVSSRMEAGNKVKEREIVDALDLMVVVNEALSASPGKLKIASIQREPAATWRIITDRGPAIHWGFYTDDPPQDEPHTREKAELLRRRLCEVKDPSLLEYVKVYTVQAPVKPRTAAAAEIVTTAVTQAMPARPRR
jgi:hypothetical protein